MMWEPLNFIDSNKRHRFEDCDTMLGWVAFLHHLLLRTTSTIQIEKLEGYTQKGMQHINELFFFIIVHTKMW